MDAWTWAALAMASLGLIVFLLGLIEAIGVNLVNWAGVGYGMVAMIVGALLFIISPELLPTEFEDKAAWEWVNRVLKWYAYANIGKIAVGILFLICTYFAYSSSWDVDFLTGVRRHGVRPARRERPAPRPAPRARDEDEDEEREPSPGPRARDEDEDEERPHAAGRHQYVAMFLFIIIGIAFIVWGWTRLAQGSLSPHVDSKFELVKKDAAAAGMITSDSPFGFRITSDKLDENGELQRWADKTSAFYNQLNQKARPGNTQTLKDVKVKAINVISSDRWNVSYVAIEFDARLVTPPADPKDKEKSEDYTNRYMAIPWDEGDDGMKTWLGNWHTYFSTQSMILRNPDAPKPQGQNATGLPPASGLPNPPFVGKTKP